MTTYEEAFARWVPTDSPWSDWAKPALFATAPTGIEGESSLTPDTERLSHLPEPRERTAIVVDLPGVDTVTAALALADRGYRVVPLYNTTCGANPVLDVEPIARALVQLAPRVANARIRDDAPPAFLIDSRRMTPTAPPSEGRFDNRWLVFPQDFPSGAFLRAAGIERALWLGSGGRPQDDLAHVLLRWQEAGIALSSTSPAPDTEIRPLAVSKPPLFRRAWYRLLAVMSLRRSNVGGFGAIIPVASAG